MTNPTVTHGNERTGATPEKMALLHTLAFTALRLALTQLDAFTSRLCEVLPYAAGKAESEEDAEHLRHAFEHLNGHRATFHRLAADCLQRELLQAVEATGALASSDPASGAMDLSLITFEAMQRKVLIDNLSQAIDGADADLLAVLSMRVAAWLQAEELGVAQNPFRAETFLKAVSDAWSTFDLQGAGHHLVLRQLRPKVFLQLGPIWQALNQEFEVRGVLPDAEEMHRQRKATRDAIPAPTHVDALRQWLAPEGVLNPNTARTLQLLEAIIAHLVRDERIPHPVRALLARLHPSLRIVARADMAFFFDESHPVRRLLERFLKTGLACAPEQDADDVLVQAIERIVAPLLSENDVPPDAWTDAADALDNLAAEEDAKLKAKLGALIPEAVRQENDACAEKLAAEDVALRIESGDVPTTIEEFLQSHWTRVLAFAYGVRDSKPDVLPAVQKIMDDLIDSVRPRASAEARKELVDSLPSLLSGLNAWLNVVKWEGEERDAFLAALAERHAAALRAPVELSPRARLEQHMESLQKASEHDIRRRVREQQEALLADYMRMIDGMAPGQWTEFVRNDGSRLNCKLLWISPARKRLIFTGRQGQLMFTLADDALAQGLRAERVGLIPTGRMVEQAMSAASRELGIL